MSFDARYYTQAENELSALREKNKLEFEARQRHIEKFPELDRLWHALGNTTVKLLRLVADRPADFAERIAKIEHENLELQDRIKYELVRSGLSQDYLDEIYTCPKCRDTGIADGKHCECFMERVRRAAANAINASSPMSLCKFEDFKLTYYDNSNVLSIGCTANELMSENLKVCKRYAENFHIPYGSILMHGATGLGKTHLSLCIAAAVLNKGYSAVYGSAPDLLRSIEKEHFGEEEETGTMDMMLGADLLILDDLGAEFEKKFYVSAIYNIINNRMNASRPTIVSTNLTHTEIKERYSDRIFSRLVSMEDMPFAGSDVRIQKRMKTNK